MIKAQDDFYWRFRSYGVVGCAVRHTGSIAGKCNVLPIIITRNLSQLLKYYCRHKKNTFLVKLKIWRCLNDFKKTFFIEKIGNFKVIVTKNRLNNHNIMVIVKVLAEALE